MSTSDNSSHISLGNSTMTSSDHRIALVVGINNSKASSRLETLKYAEEDAFEVSRILRQDACGFASVDPDPSVLIGDKAKTGDVRSAILRLLAKRTEPDFLLFYFIGHAQPVKTKDGQSDIYLVTYDFDPAEAIEDPPAHLSLSWLRKIFYQSKGAGKLLIVLDCCYAGNMIEIKSDSAHIHIDINVREVVEQCLGVSPVNYQMGRARVMLTATGYNQPAQERRMTKLFLSALQGKISHAADHEGCVNIHSLYTYLQSQMPKEQLPNLSGDFPKACVLARYPHLSENQQREILKAEKDGLKTEVSKLADQLAEVSKIITDPQFFEKQAATSQHLYIPYFDHMIASGTSFADLQLDNCVDFFRRDRVLFQDDFRLEASTHDQLRQFGLLQEGQPTYGALLCFGLDPTKLLPGAYTKCIRWIGNERHNGWLDAQDYRGNLIKQFELSRSFLRKHLQLIRVINRDDRNEELEIPLVALAEALANALVHREYLNQTSPVYIDIFDTRIEINSPGTPPEPMTMELLETEHKSHPRNPQIARLFYLYTYAETVGSGIHRIQRALEKAGLPLATFELCKDKTFKVTFLRPRQLSDEVRSPSTRIQVLQVLTSSRLASNIEIGAGETRAIRESIRQSRYRDNLALTVRDVTTPHELRRALLENEFQIVHFSGHGTNDSLVFEDDSGKPTMVSQHALANLLKSCSPPLQCVILNACYSGSQEPLESLGVPFTITMDAPISDKSAQEFAKGFYEALAAGKSIIAAYEEGIFYVKLATPNNDSSVRMLKSNTETI